MVKPEGASYLTRVSYRLFGSRIRVLTTRFKTFRDVYRRSGLSRQYESYVSLTLFTYFTVFASTLIAGALLHGLLLNLTLPRYLIAVLALSSVVSLTVPVLFLLYPLIRRNQRRSEIDSNLVYTSGYMGVLSAGGLPIERVFERVLQVEEHRSIKDLAKRLIADVKVFGMDVISGLNDVALRSPSESLSKLLIGIANTVRTSGDFTSLLTYETKRLLHLKREKLKRTLATLVTLGEIYVALMVMGPIVLMIMLTILSIMGNVALGLSPVEQLNLLVFFGLPAASLVFIVVLNGVLPEED